MSPDFGPRYMKYSIKLNSYYNGGSYWDSQYFGEWSRETNEARGRGIEFNGRELKVGYWVENPFPSPAGGYLMTC